MTLRILPSSAHTFTRTLLTHHSVPPSHSSIIATCLIEADLRGVDSHGINRLPSYLSRIRHGVLDPRATPTLTRVTPAVSKLDGRNAFGFIAASMGMDEAIRLARESGIGMVSVSNSNHFGMAASFVRQAVDAGMMSLVFTNSSPALPAWGGREKLLGVSPIAAGAPAGKDGVPFIFDMAPSVVARGKVYKALRRGESIPAGWGLDVEGRETRDPRAVVEGGVMLPVGGPKGSGLSVMMDVFSGVFSGSAFAGHVTGPYDVSRKADVGHFIVAVKPDLFVSLEEFKGRMDYLYRRVVGGKKMEGVDRIYYPGEIELITAKERERDGIPYVQAEIDALNEEADRVGAPHIEVMNG